jgi:FtsP/CotA-like multicopper oxidase with cupredoxin domain
MTLLGLLGLFACASEAETTALTVLESPWVGSPREAFDLDPDPSVLRVRLRATPTADGRLAWQDLDAEGQPREAMSPGPTLRARVGETLVVTLENALEEPTTIHWHGVAAPNAMDGAGWMDDAVAPGGTFTYTIPLTRAGTFWYHPHMAVARQVDLGLYGFLVVEDPEEPPLEQELLLAFDTRGETTEDSGGGHVMRRLARMEDTAHGEAAGEGAHGHAVSLGAWTVNGRSDARVAVRAGARVRARLLNASNAAYLDVRGPPMWRVADDQGRLGAPEQFTRLLLAPGDRAEVVWLPGGGEDFTLEAAPFTLLGGEALGDPRPLLPVDVSGDASPAALPDLGWSGSMPTPDTAPPDHVYVLSGDVLADDWRINRERWPEVTPTEIPLGEVRVLEVRNLSPTRHPFHVHGHAFEVLSVQGVAPASRTFADTIDVGVREVVRLRLLADNPGPWMIHCHVLGHEEQGMMTLLQVSEPSGAVWP